MANDAVILSLTSLEFTWRIAHTMKGYLVGVATDSFGDLHVVEPPSSTFIKHRPLLGRPFAWPLAFQGFTIYQRTGGLPDFVNFSLMIVRDRNTARRAGAVLRSLGTSAEYRGLLARAGELARAPAAAAVSAAAAIAEELMGLIGKHIAEAKDKLLDTLVGGYDFTPEARATSEVCSKVKGAIASAEFDFHLFDASTDTPSRETVELSLSDLRARGLLIGSSSDPNTMTDRGDASADKANTGTTNTPTPDPQAKAGTVNTTATANPKPGAS